jgi:hypothetical protein
MFSNEITKIFSNSFLHRSSICSSEALNQVLDAAEFDHLIPFFPIIN